MTRHGQYRGGGRALGYVVVALVAALAGACTLGLGDYPSRGDRLPASPDVGAGPDTPASSDAAGEPESEPEVDAAAPPVEGGACVDGTLDTTCKLVEGDAGATCTGARRCVRSTWSACKVDLKCPGTWPSLPVGGSSCEKLDAKGDSARWVDSPMVGAPVTLWALDRASPFELYGTVDSFCFEPKELVSCIDDATTVVSVECEGKNLKLSGNSFLEGTVRNREFCVEGAGAYCRIIDVHGGGGGWQTPAAPRCERWFEGAHWRAQAAPRCSW